MCPTCFARYKPLVMMVSADRVLIKLPRSVAR